MNTTTNWKQHQSTIEYVTRALTVNHAASPITNPTTPTYIGLRVKRYRLLETNVPGSSPMRNFNGLVNQIAGVPPLVRKAIALSR